jgi:hypothetical protein
MKDNSERDRLSDNKVSIRLIFSTLEKYIADFYRVINIFVFPVLLQNVWCTTSQPRGFVRISIFLRPEVSYLCLPDLAFRHRMHHNSVLG